MEIEKIQQKINKIKDDLREIDITERAINDTERTILKEQIAHFLKHYNVHNVNVDRRMFKEYKNHKINKTLYQLEEEIKNYFSQYTQNDKINELLRKISFYDTNKRDLSDSKRKLLSQFTTRLIELKTGELPINVFWDKISRWGEYSFRGYEVLYALEELFKLVCGVDVDFSPKHTGYKPYQEHTLSEWQETNGFKYKAFLNGKLLIKGNEDCLRKIKDLLLEELSKRDHNFTIIDN